MCHYFDRVGRHTRWCPGHSESLEIQAHKNTGSCWHHLRRWLHSDRAQTDTHQHSLHNLFLRTLLHTGTCAQSQECPYRCHHFGIVRLSKWSHCPGNPHPLVQWHSGKNSHWFHSHRRTWYRCRGYSGIHLHPGCSWALWSHLGSGRWTYQSHDCWYSWCMVTWYMHHTAPHSFYPCTTLVLWDKGTHSHPGGLSMWHHCGREMKDTCPRPLCTVGLEWEWKEQSVKEAISNIYYLKWKQICSLENLLLLLYIWSFTETHIQAKHIEAFLYA